MLPVAFNMRQWCAFSVGISYVLDAIALSLFQIVVPVVSFLFNPVRDEGFRAKSTTLECANNGKRGKLCDSAQAVCGCVAQNYD